MTNHLEQVLYIPYSSMRSMAENNIFILLKIENFKTNNSVIPDDNLQVLILYR